MRGLFSASGLLEALSGYSLQSVIVAFLSITGFSLLSGLGIPFIKGIF